MLCKPEVTGKVFFCFGFTNKSVQEKLAALRMRVSEAMCLKVFFRVPNLQGLWKDIHEHKLSI